MTAKKKVRSKGPVSRHSKPFPVAVDSGTQTRPAVSFNPADQTFLVAWLHQAGGVGGPWEVVGAVFNEKGKPVLPAMALSDAACPYDNAIQAPIALCYEERDGSWIMAWDDRTNVYGRRLFPDGTLEPARVLAAGDSGPANEHPAVAYGRKGEEVLLISRDGGAGRLEGRRFSPDLETVLSKKLITTASPGPPSVAYAEKRNSFFMVYTRGPGFLKEVVGREMAEGDKLSPEVVLADIPGIAPRTVYSPAVDDMVALYIDGRFDVISVNVFGQLGRGEISGINASTLPSHRVVNSVRAVRVNQGRSGTLVLWHDNLFAASQRARFVKLYDDGTLSLKRLVTGLEAMDPDGAYDAKRKILFTVFTRPVDGGYHIYGRILRPAE